MPSSPDFVAHCVELFAPLGAVRAKRMFGGHGIYVDEVFIAIVDDDTLFLKADETTRAKFEAAGCRPFTYEAKGERVSLGYWTAPEETLESPALLQPWARLAMEAALRARNAKPAIKRKAPARPKAAPAKPKPSARRLR